MKRIIAILLVCMLLGSAAFAAEWPAGRSPSQPYSGNPPVDLTKTMGYIILFPRTKLPARTFCDVLQVFLPREDVELGSGTVRLMQMVDGKAAEVCSTEISAPGMASIREVGTEFGDIMTQIGQTKDDMLGISEAVQKLADSTQEIVQVVDNIDTISRKTSENTQTISAAAEQQGASTEEIAAASRSLAGLAEELQTAAKKFKV